MIVVVQFPFIDIRQFKADVAKPIPNPKWTFLNGHDINASFVRSIGPVARRRNGETASGDNYFIRARSALRFENGLRRLGNSLAIVRYRSLLFDGYSTGKYEICFDVRNKSLSYDHQQFQDLIKSILELKVSIPIPFNGNNNEELVKSFQYLTVQFLNATSHKKIKNGEKITGVYPGNIAIFIESGPREQISHSFPLSVTEELNEVRSSMTKSLFKVRNKNIYIWHLRRETETDEVTQSAREIRLAMMKSNAFREGLNIVIDQIHQGKLLPLPDTAESGALQEYLKKAFKYVNPKTSTLSEERLGTINYALESRLVLENRIQFEDNLRTTLNLRRNYFNSIITYLDTLENAATIISKKIVLLMSAGPEDQEPLRLAEEQRQVSNAFERTLFRNYYDFKFEPNIRFSDMQHFMQKHNPLVLHYSGHGDEDGIFLVDTDGNTQLLPAETLQELISILKLNLQCVLFINCDSVKYALDISRLGLTTIGMAGKISDDAARLFVLTFYQSIGNGADFETSFRLAKNALYPYPKDHKFPTLWRNGAVIE
ncbi:MAG: CHAT domain-containing protein [Chryseolinea sp.]